jgi:hypothetical protein
LAASPPGFWAIVRGNCKKLEKNQNGHDLELSIENSLRIFSVDYITDNGG